MSDVPKINVLMEVAGHKGNSLSSLVSQWSGTRRCTGSNSVLHIVRTFSENFAFPTCKPIETIFEPTRYRFGSKNAILGPKMAFVAPVLRRDESTIPGNNEYGRWLKITLFSAIAILIYGRVLVDLAIDWWTIPAQSQGLLIPPLAAYIAWGRRRMTLAIPEQPDARGLGVIACACLFFLAGKMGAEFFLMRSSFIILLAGTAATFWGWRRLRSLALPLLILATMVPLPALVYNAAATPLQLLASGIATDIARVFGVSVFRDGNIIHLANISLGVEEACSGLSSLTALFVGAILLGYLNCRHNLSRLLLIVLSIPIAIAMNVLRVAGTAIIADYHQEFAMGFYHAFSGWLVFLAGFGTLYLSARLLYRKADPLLGKVTA
jgi:exosortase